MAANQVSLVKSIINDTSSVSESNKHTIISDGNVQQQQNDTELLNLARIAYIEWTEVIETEYSMDDVGIIESFVAHFHNIDHGFGASSKKDYQRTKTDSDPHGLLEAIARNGWQLFYNVLKLEKQYPEEAQLYYEQEKQSRGCSSKFRRNCNRR